MCLSWWCEVVVNVGVGVKEVVKRVNVVVDLGEELVK